jgi:glycosyltransferase involved in cell wall biosynthesis
MRIAMLTRWYPPVIGGEERHVRDLSIGLTLRGHHVIVITFWREGLPEFEIDQGVAVYRIRPSVGRFPMIFSVKTMPPHAPPFPDPEALWIMRGIIQHEHPDIVHAHNWIVHSFTPLKTWSKAKLIVTLHDSSLVCATQRFLYQGCQCTGPKLQKCLSCASSYYGRAKGIPTTLASKLWNKIECRTVDMFLSVSQSNAEINQLSTCGTPYRIIPNFIPQEVEMLPDDDPMLTQLPTGPYLMFAGTLVFDKGVKVLLRAYAALKTQIPLVLIGRPRHDFSADLSPNVYVLHSWPHNAVMSAWSRCLIGLVPSITPDPCPTVAIEAMAMGCPVIGSDIGGIPEIVIDGRTGLLVAPGNWQAFQQAIHNLLENPARREDMGMQARQRAKEFQSATIVPRIEQVYEEALRI